MWFKVDDKLWGHPKWMSLPAGARALWVTAGSYCASNETDGRLAAAMLPPLGGRPRDADKLVESGLWERVEGGYQFHDWADYQPTKAQVRADREAAKERQRKWREARASQRDRGVSNAVTNGVTNAVSNGAPTRPDPTPPTPPSRTASPTSPTPSSAGADGDIDFADFWELYPRKVNRSAAFTAWRRATRDTTAVEILAGLRSALPTLEQRDTQFVPHAESWLRKKRWTDAPPEPERDPWAHLPHASQLPDYSTPSPTTERTTP